jgi:hypothetical protein
MVKFGQPYANGLRRKSPRPGNRWFSIPKIQTDMRRLCLDQPYSSLPRAIRLPVLVRAPARQSMPCYLRPISYLWAGNSGL